MADFNAQLEHWRKMYQCGIVTADEYRNVINTVCRDDSEALSRRRNFAWNKATEILFRAQTRNGVMSIADENEFNHYRTVIQLCDSNFGVPQLYAQIYSSYSSISGTEKRACGCSAYIQCSCVEVTAIGDPKPEYLSWNKSRPAVATHIYEDELKWIPSDYYSGGLHPATRKFREEPTAEQKALNSYNEVYDRSIGIGMYTGTYRSWRYEFEATGAEFAKERMLAAYKPGDESQVSYDKPGKLEISMCWDTPLLWIGIVIIAVMTLLILL